MGCSCCSNELNKESLLSKQKNQKIQKFVKSKKENPKIRIDTINSINSINFNGVLNITFKDDGNKNKNDFSKAAHHLLTELSNSYISRRTSDIKNNDKNEVK